MLSMLFWSFVSHSLASPSGGCSQIWSQRVASTQLSFEQFIEWCPEAKFELLEGLPHIFRLQILDCRLPHMASR